MEVLLVAIAISLANGFQVSTYQDCKVYLCEYGYMDSQHCACSIKVPIRGSGAPGMPLCSDENFALSLAAFQKDYGLKQTSVCDFQTQVSMTSASRGAAGKVLAAPSSLPNGVGTRKPEGDASSTFGLIGNHGQQAAEVVHRDIRATDSQRHYSSSSVRNSMVRLLETGRKRAATISKPVLIEASGRPIRGRPTAKSASTSESTSRRERSAGEPELPAGRYNSAMVLEGDKDRAEREWAYVLNKSIQEHLHRNDRTGVRSDRASAAKSRIKKSTPVSNSSVLFDKNTLRWRILSGFYNPMLPAITQEAALEFALRKWSAVTPLCFIKDLRSDVAAIDIQIAFANGEHLGDGRPFDGPGGEIAHSFPGLFSHFDAAENWYIGAASSSTGTSLVAAAVHEFGHLIGLRHSVAKEDVMYSIYSEKTSLGEGDLAAASDLYGQCGGKFDAVFDVQYTQNALDSDGNLANIIYYSTIFFRGSYNWLYKNTIGRSPEGEPQSIAATWNGIPNAVDAVVQYYQDPKNGTFDSTIFFLKGTRVYVYDYTNFRVISSGAINSYFKSGPSGQSIPNNVDSAYYDPRDNYIYFFKGTLVYVYNYDPYGPHSCCVNITKIADMFPLAPSKTRGITYQQAVDAVYYSQTTRGLHFFAGEKVWVIRNSTRGPSEGSYPAEYYGLWNQHWRYICEIEC